MFVSTLNVIWLILDLLLHLHTLKKKIRHHDRNKKEFLL